MTEFSDPRIQIGDQVLSVGQAMAVRVAVTSFYVLVQGENALGEDEHGRAMAALYRARLDEVVPMLLALP